MMEASIIKQSRENDLGEIEIIQGTENDFFFLVSCCYSQRDSRKQCIHKAPGSYVKIVIT